METLLTVAAMIWPRSRYVSERAREQEMRFEATYDEDSHVEEYPKPNLLLYWQGDRCDNGDRYGDYGKVGADIEDCLNNCIVLSHSALRVGWRYGPIARKRSASCRDGDLDRNITQNYPNSNDFDPSKIYCPRRHPREREKHTCFDHPDMSQHALHSCQRHGKMSIEGELTCSETMTIFEPRIR
jgi:hypothetical protein